MVILTVVASVVLIIEFTLAAVANLTGMPAAVARFRELTGHTLTRVAMLGVGLLDAVGLAGVIAGFWYPVAGVVGAALLAGYALAVLVGQYRRGTRSAREYLAYGLFLACAVLVVVGRAAEGGADGRDGAAGAGTGAEVRFEPVELPAGAAPAVLTPAADGLLVGVRRDGRPGLLRRAPDGALAELPLAPATPYGREATWRSLAVDGDRLLAIGGERGGAHGNVRWSVWTGSGGLTEQPQGFSTFGGWGAGDLVGAVLTPVGPALVGTWQSAQVGFDVAVWTPDGDTWVRQDPAGTALQSRRGSLGFPLAATALQRGILVAGWRLEAGRQQPVVWRSESGNAGWQATPLPLDGQAGAAVAVRCWGTVCGVTGWVDGRLAVWRLADGRWTRLAGVPPIAVGDRDPLVAPVEVDGRLTLVVPADGRLQLVQADGERWTVRAVAGPTGSATALASTADGVYLVAGPAESARALWRVDLTSLR